MKTIVETTTGLSKYVFEDSVDVIVRTDRIVTPAFIIGDLNGDNSHVYDNVTPPDDWIGNKYTFDGTTWTANPDWVEPEAVEEGDV